jgi:AraC-like DNA-binding protein
MLLAHQTLFDSELFTIRYAVARPSALPLSELEHARADLLLLPVAGLFARHDSPKHHFVANANHGLFFSHGQPYRISFPGGIGDDCLVFQWAKPALANLLAETAGTEELSSGCIDRHCLLSPATVVERELLQAHLKRDAADALAIEEISVSLLSASIRAAHKHSGRKDHAKHSLTKARRQMQAEAVKELISLHPARAWTLSALAREAAASPYHLARVFREEVGVPIHQYLIRTRIGHALAAMRSESSDLTGIALEAGFAHHSHFTSSFRELFGITPSEFRHKRLHGTAAGN